MKKDWVLTQEAFDAFLSWLSPDRDRAAAEYEKIRLRLLRFFDYRGCDDSEKLADETINRVTERVFRAEPDGIEFPPQFIYGVAKNIFLESFSKPKIFALNEDLPPSDLRVSENDFLGSDDAQNCMRLCLKQLKKEEAELIYAYFRVDKKIKREQREAIGKKNGEAMNTVRVRISRIRQKLQKCRKNCLNGKK